MPVPRSICEFGRDDGRSRSKRHGGLATVVKDDAPALQRFLELLEGVVVGMRPPSSKFQIVFSATPEAAASSARDI